MPNKRYHCVCAAVAVAAITTKRDTERALAALSSSNGHAFEWSTSQ